MTDDVSILALSLDTWQKVARGLWGVDMWHFGTSVTLFGFPIKYSKNRNKIKSNFIKIGN